MLPYHRFDPFLVPAGERVHRADRAGASEVQRHGAGGDPPPMPQCVGLSCRFSGRAGRVHAGFTESTRAASYLVPSARVHESGRCTLPFRGGNIKGRPAGGGPGFSGTAGTCRVRVRNPGALRGRLGAGVVAYVPRYGAYVTLSRAPRESALFPVHCCHSSLPRAVCVGRIYSGLWRNYG